MTSTGVDLPLSSVGQRFATAILSFVTVLAAPLAAAVVAPLTATAVWQLIAVGVGAVVTFIVPLIGSKWQGLFKTGFAILGAVAAALIPIVSSTWTAQSTLIVVIAVVNILATELGVQIRTATPVPATITNGVYNVTSVPDPAVVSQAVAAKLASSPPNVPPGA
jgi:hypothetical protein